MPEGFIPLDGSAGNAAPFGGRRRSHKKLRLVKKKTVRAMLAKKGLKMRGGGEVKEGMAAPPAAAAMGGRRRHRKSAGTRRHRRRSLFGMKY